MCVCNDTVRILSNSLRIAIFQNFGRLLQVSPETNMSLFSLFCFISKVNYVPQFANVFWHRLMNNYLMILKLKNFDLKGGLSGLKQFLATESPLKMIKNAFCFTWKALFVLKIFKFLSLLFCHITKRLDQKDKLRLISSFMRSQPG